MSVGMAGPSGQPDQNGNGHKGLQAYRWMVSIGMAATLALATWILTTVKETANDVTNLKIQLSTLTANQVHQSARLDSIDRRNDSQDEKITDLQRRVWQWQPPAASRAPEDQQRQQWQK